MVEVKSLTGGVRWLSVVLFVGWLVLTTVILCTPGRTVRQTATSVRSSPAVQSQSETTLYRVFNDGGNWHSVLFLVLGILATGFLPRGCPSKRGRVGTVDSALVSEATRGNTIRRVMSLLVALSAYSLFTELIQKYCISGRTFQWQDLILNEGGLAVGLGVGVAVRWCGSGLCSTLRWRSNT